MGFKRIVLNTCWGPIYSDRGPIWGQMIPGPVCSITTQNGIFAQAICRKLTIVGGITKTCVVGSSRLNAQASLSSGAT